MSELNRLIIDKLLPLKREGLEIFSKQHPIIYTALNKFLSGRISKVGLQITDKGNIIGTYTIVMDGIHIVQAEPGSLDPKVTLPLWGEIKPYSIIEKNDLEEALDDTSIFTGDILKNSMKYLPMVTIRFLK